jgi:hypothetical protein
MSSSSRSLRQPSYRHHKTSGQAVATIDGKDRYLGKHGTPENKKANKWLMLEWLANDGCLPPSNTADLLVSEVTLAYKRFAKRYYQHDGRPSVTYPTRRRR